MENIKLAIINIVLKKYVLGYLVIAWEKIKGWKTLLFIIWLFFIPFLQTHGWITPEQAKELNAIFGTGAGFSFMQKLQRYKPLVENAFKNEVMK